MSKVYRIQLLRKISSSMLFIWRLKQGMGWLIAFEKPRKASSCWQVSHRWVRR